jgi:hypothetical protein
MMSASATAKAPSRDDIRDQRLSLSYFQFSHSLIFPPAQRYPAMVLRCSHLYTSLRNLISSAVKKVLRTCSSERLACFSVSSSYLVASPSSITPHAFCRSAAQVPAFCDSWRERCISKCACFTNVSSPQLRIDCFLVSHINEECANCAISEPLIYHGPTLEIPVSMIIRVSPQKYGIWSSAKRLP